MAKQGGSRKRRAQPTGRGVDVTTRQVGRVASPECLENRRALAVDFPTQQLIDSLEAEGPTALATADVNGDGRLDVIVGSYDDNRVGWFQQQADGSFNYQRIANDQRQVRSLVTADFDGDGDIDVAVGSYGDDRIVWFENTDRHGQFGAARTITNETDGVRALDVADLDGDGDTDLVSASWFDNKIAWFKNDGHGQFSDLQLITSFTVGPRSVRVGDINGDGRLDVFAASRGDDRLVWFANQGQGIFGATQTLNTNLNGPEWVALGDLDGDRDLDVAVALYHDGTLAWFENTDGRGNFGPQHDLSTTARRGQTIAIADLDGDRDLDIVGASYYELDNKLVWFRNEDGKGTFSAERLVSNDVQGVKAVVLADVNADRQTDIVSISMLDDKVTWFANQSGQFGKPLSIASDASGAASIELADLDGDHDLDALVASYWDNEIAWYENIDGKGQYRVQRVITQDARRAQFATAADLDGDGDLDVLSASAADGKVAWYANLDGRGTFGAPQIITNRLGSPVYVVAADFDGDHDLDVATASSSDGIVAWFENTSGRGTFGPIRVVTRRAVDAEWLDVADLDGDGDLDLVSASYGDDTIGWFANSDGHGAFGSRQTLMTGDGPSAAEVGDLDGDGDLDIVATLYNESRVVWMERLPGATPTFAPPDTLATGARRVEGLRLVNLDGNTGLDILIAGDTYVAALTRVSNDNFPLVVMPGSVEQAFSVDAGDVNGDGALDIVSASFQDSRIALYLNAPAGGDFDHDADVDTTDIDLLCAAIRKGSTEPGFDLDRSGQVNAADLQKLLDDILHTVPGDVNLDGLFNSRDLVLIFQAGEYEDAESGNSGWAEGDWDCDGEFNTRDLVVAFQTGAYSAAAEPLAAWEIASAVDQYFADPHESTGNSTKRHGVAS